MNVRNLKLVSILFILSILAFSCSNMKALKVPTIGFQGINLDSVQPDFNLQSLKLDFELKFKFKNPDSNATRSTSQGEMG